MSGSQGGGRSVRTAVPGPRSVELGARRAAAVPTGVGVTLPVFIERASAGLLEDVDGNRFIDLGSGIAVTTVATVRPKWSRRSGSRPGCSRTPASR